MAEPHPAASHHLPAFITPPGETDVLMVVMSVFLALIVVMFGVLFLRLHSLPDQIAHKSHKLQAEIVGVLCLIALFTHMHIFWIAALLLALIDLPDFGTSLGRIADSTETLAGRRSREGTAELPPTAMADAKQTDASIVPQEVTPAASAVPSFLARARLWTRGVIAALGRWWRRIYSSRADGKAREGAAELPSQSAGVQQTYAREVWLETHGKEKQGNGTASTKPDSQGPPFDYPAHVKGS